MTAEPERQKFVWRVRYARKYLRRRLNHIVVEAPAAHPLENALWICSWQRSGSTWLAEMLAHQRGTRLVYEPANVPDGLVSGDASADIPLPREGDPATFAVVRALRGVERGDWVDQMAGTHFARRRVVKDVRAMALAPSIRTKCPETPVVILTRHPIAVARSKVDLGWTSGASRSDDFATEVQQWCEIHAAALRDTRLANVHFVTYEALRENPQARVAAIRDYALGFSSTWRGLSTDTLDPTRPSATNFRSTTVGAADGWGDLDDALIHRAVEIMRDYGFDGLYDDQPGARSELDSFVHHFRASVH